MSQRVIADHFLSEKFPVDFLKEALIHRQDWHPYPTIEDRAAWEGLPEPLRQSNIVAAEEWLAEPWPHLPANVYLQFSRNGNRINYEQPYFLRRTILGGLVLAECMEGQGRFLDAIANAIWSLCEESSWCIPAHIGAQQAGSGLPDVDEPIVDLFAAETSVLLAWTDYLLGERLDGVSPLVRQRVRREIDTRILSPVMERDDFWWMGFTPKLVNNWNPWINSNWLASVLLMEDYQESRAAAVAKILLSLDRFITPYPRDGGCDEGPSYWSRAGASLFDCLETLYSATGGRLDVYDDPLVQDIGRFIYRAHIAGDYFVNFADAAARLLPDGALVYRYGKRIDDEAMQNFGAWAAREAGMLETGYTPIGRVPSSLNRVLPVLFGLEELQKAPARPPLLRDVWLNQIEVMAARDRAGTSEGFYLAAKGGHNDESHNHNDVGHFVVYLDGKPLLVDAGVETYTRKTFSPQRYEIWTMQSGYHALPTIDGVMQSPGRAFAARDVTYHADDERARLSLEISAAYPPEAKLASWHRAIVLERGSFAEVVDAFELTSPVGEILFNLLTTCRVAEEAPGVLRLAKAALAGGEVSAQGHVHFDAARLTWSVEEILTNDERMSASWGSRLARIQFRLVNPPLKDQVTFRITR